MNRLSFRITLPCILLTSGFFNCVNLQHVNNFSSSALESVKKFEEIDYGFKQHCLDNCYDLKINDLSFNIKECDCQTNEKADSITLIIYQAVKGYFGGLTNLSNNKLTDYKINALSKSLAEIDLNAVKIDKSQVEAYSAISGILLRSITDKYRQHKIKEYLKAGNEPLKVLLSFMDFNLSSNLSGKLNVQKQVIKGDYFDLTKDLTLSTWEKRKVVEAYYSRLGTIESKQKELLTYSKSLRKIAAGHQKLTDNLDRINEDEIKEQLTQYTSDIQDLISEFNKALK
jgi:hypothetical protein